MAGSGRQPQPLQKLRIRFEQAAIVVFGDGSHARAGELGDVVAVGEIIMRLARRGDRKAGKRGEASAKGERGDRDPHAHRVEPPQQTKRRDRQRGDNRHGPPQIWKDGQEERNRIGIDDHDVDEIYGREQDRFLEPGKKTQRHDHGHCKRGRRQWPSQHHEPKEVQQPPGQTEGNARSEAVLAPHHQCQRGEMNENGESHQRQAVTSGGRCDVS